MAAYPAADREAAIDRAIQEGYRRQPQGGELDRDEWGDVGGLVTALTVGLARAVPAEEREAGDEPSR